MRRYSASKVGLLRRCRYWAAPDAVWDEDESTMAARLGSALSQASADRQAARKVDLDAIGDTFDLDDDARAGIAKRWAHLVAYRGVPLTALAEVAFACDPLAGEAREIGREIGRAYAAAGAKACEIGGAVDLIWMSGTRVVIRDIKSGRHGSLAEHREQLETLSYMAAKAWRAEDADIGTFHVTEDGVTEDAVVLSAFALDMIGAELRADAEALDADIANGTLAPRPGDHCTSHYCPMRASCPATAEAVTSLIPAESLVARHKLVGPIASAEEARYRLALLPVLSKVVEAFKGQLRDYADAHGGIETDEGTWRRIDSISKSLVADQVALDILDRELGPVGSMQAVEMSISASSIKRAVTALGHKPVKPMADRIVDAVKAAGCVKTTSRTTYDVVTSKRECAT